MDGDDDHLLIMCVEWAVDDRAAAAAASPAIRQHFSLTRLEVSSRTPMAKSSPPSLLLSSGDDRRESRPRRRKKPPGVLPLSSRVRGRDPKGTLSWREAGPPNTLARVCRPETLLHVRSADCSPRRGRRFRHAPRWRNSPRRASTLAWTRPRRHSRQGPAQARLRLGVVRPGRFFERDHRKT